MFVILTCFNIAVLLVAVNALLVFGLMVCVAPEGLWAITRPPQRLHPLLLFRPPGCTGSAYARYTQRSETAFYIYRTGICRHRQLKYYTRIYSYRPPTKLEEGNAFNHVCVSVHRVGSHVTIICDALNLTVKQPPVQTCDLTGQGSLPEMWPHWPGTPSIPGTSLGRDPLLVTSGGHHWRPVQTC